LIAGFLGRVVFDLDNPWCKRELSYSLSELDGSRANCGKLEVVVVAMLDILKGRAILGWKLTELTAALKLPRSIIFDLSWEKEMIHRKRVRK
jgi:hypothetical protein